MSDLHFFHRLTGGWRMASIELDQFRLPLMAFHGQAAFMGFCFSVIVAAGGNPVTPELYGEAVYAIPAAAWGVVQTLLGFACVVALSSRRMGCLAVSSFLSMLFYAALGSLAIRADQGTLVAIGSATIMLPPSVVTFLYATERWRE